MKSMSVDSQIMDDFCFPLMIFIYKQMKVCFSYYLQSKIYPKIRPLIKQKVFPLIIVYKAFNTSEKNSRKSCSDFILRTEHQGNTFFPLNMAKVQHQYLFLCNCIHNPVCTADRLQEPEALFIQSGFEIIFQQFPFFSCIQIRHVDPDRQLPWGD